MFRDKTQSSDRLIEDAHMYSRESEDSGIEKPIYFDDSIAYEVHESCQKMSYSPRRLRYTGSA